MPVYLSHRFLVAMKYLCKMFFPVVGHIIISSLCKDIKSFNKAMKIFELWRLCDFVFMIVVKCSVLVNLALMFFFFF